MATFAESFCKLLQVKPGESIWPVLSLVCFILFLVLIKEMREGIETKILLCYPRGLGASPQFSRVRWHNVVRVECL